MDSVTEQTFRSWTKRLRRSDERALDELFDATFEQYVRYAWRYTKDKPSAIDVVQECFIKLWQIRDRLDSSQSLKTYIYRMVKHRALNYLRDRQQDTVPVDDLQLADTAAAPADVVEEESPLAHQLRRWIGALPKRQKQAFEMSRYEGLTHDEIADVMNVSARTVNNHIVTALNTLKEQYRLYRENREHAL